MKKLEFMSGLKRQVAEELVHEMLQVKKVRNVEKEEEKDQSRNFVLEKTGEGSLTQISNLMTTKDEFELTFTA